jgi:hypothetical protein
MLLAIIDARLDGLAGVVKDIKEAVKNVSKYDGEMKILLKQLVAAKNPPDAPQEHSPPLINPVAGDNMRRTRET